MFYNVENLFDTIDDPLTQDEEFTPGSEKNWDIDKYEKKLKDISRIIESVSTEELPGIIGFAELENEKVLLDLRDQKRLKQEKYEVLLIDGNDPRGIDCGMLYRPDMFELKSREMLPVKDLSGDNYPLRGILHIIGKGPDNKDLHIYINHWKSRYGGVKETEEYRIFSAIALRRELDRLLESDSNSRIIIMGDFNDEPTNHSIYQILQAGNKRKNIRLNDTYNLFYDIHNLDIAGSYCYNGVWQMYDQIILSYNLLNQDSDLSTSYDAGKIYKADWMLFHDKKNNVNIPNRTYGGNNYFGGVSDHFPVYVSFSW